MRLDGRRKSSNVEDRRGGSAGIKSISIGGIVIAAIVAWVMGGNPLEVVTQQLSDTTTQTTGEYQPTAEEQEAADFASKILAGTEDVWTKRFQSMGKTYEPPKMVYFTGGVTSGCGSASSSTGPFYCSADQTIYIDLSFFNELRDRFGAGGDFAYAYVIAHEVGHHVEYLLGTLSEAHRAMQAASSDKERNRISVRLELLADFYAGIWAHDDNKLFASMEEGDLEEGLNAATAIGDDRLQKQAQGYTVPDAFNHGTSEQRVRWLKKGYTTGDMSQGNTFALPYSDL